MWQSDTLKIVKSSPFDIKNVQLSRKIKDFLKNYFDPKRYSRKSIIGVVDDWNENRLVYTPSLP